MRETGIASGGRLNWTWISRVSICFEAVRRILQESESGSAMVKGMHVSLLASCLFLARCPLAWPRTRVTYVCDGVDCENVEVESGAVDKGGEGVRAQTTALLIWRRNTTDDASRLTRSLLLSRLPSSLSHLDPCLLSLSSSRRE